MTDENRIYPFGYGPAALEIMENRTAKSNAGLLLEYLEPGMSVLDIGCGPGTITVGLAEAVAPGVVTGVDIETSQVDLGRDRAASLGLENCRFETGSVYELPLADNSVDAVYGHTILMQFADLDPVMEEIKRVLKSGGLIGFREIDFGASIYQSESSAFGQLQQLWRKSIQHNGGNPDIGHTLPSLLASAGFDILTTGASYNYAPTPEAKVRRSAVMARLWAESEFPEQAEALGWISKSDRASMASRLDQEAADPGSFAATTCIEVVGRFV